MAVAHEELTGETWLFADHRRCSGQPDGEPFRAAAQPAGENFGCARPERRPATVSRRIPAPGYALRAPSAQTPPPELKRGKRLQSDRSGPKYAKIV
jgi:hypothetical protein